MTWEIRRLHEAILAREVGGARKDWGGRIRVALVYPNRYRAGMSNLGFLTVHARVNARGDALCERSFLPDPAEGRILSRRSLPVTTLESGMPLSQFDIVAFSLSYENDLLNLPGILSAGGVPPYRADRAAPGNARPLVLAGGFAASLNPEPSGSIADAVVVGDGERALESVLDLGAPRPHDAGYLRALASVPGVYVPCGYVPRYSEADERPREGSGRLLVLESREGFPATVAREEVPLAEYPPVPPVLAQDAELGRMALVETSRGCPRMCGFCAAAHACPGFREVPLPVVRAAAEAAWPHRKRIGLIGAAVLDWPHFRAFSREVLARGGTVSPASVRADLVDGEIAEILRHSGHRTVSLAPECGDERLRGRMGKRVTDRVFLDAGRTLVRAGIVSFKLYFLVGVPASERDEEADGTAAFLKKFRDAVLEEARSLGRMGTVTAVLSPFVPKPFTPLQWAPMFSGEELEARQKRIAAGVRGVPNLRVLPEPPALAVLQGFLGLSDRRVEHALRRARKGRLDPSRNAFAVPLREIVHREKEAKEYFPWDVVAGGLPRPVLRARYDAIACRGSSDP
jgi:radical SAM superfamily enzyme YgiQ (UPF0313 family)